MLGVKPGQCSTGVTGDADLLRSGWKKRVFVGMKERGEAKVNDPST